MRSTAQRVAAFLLGGPLFLTGCASLPGTLFERSGDEEPGVLVRPDAPADYDVLVALQFEAEGRMADALAAYQRAVAKDDSSAFLHRKLAEGLARANRLDESLYHAERAHRLEPEDVPTRLFLGQLHRLRRDAQAVESVLRGEDGDPIDPAAAFLLYQVYLETQRTHDAEQVALWWVEQEPLSVRARVALANAYQQLDRSPEAELALRDALEYHPGNLRIYGALARLMRERGDAPAEIALYREVLGIHPHHHATLVALAEAQMSLDDLEGATATFEEVEQRYPSDLRSVVRLAFLKYEAREFDQAAQRFERALEANPDEHEIAFFLGIALRRSGDPNRAVAAFERIPPDHKHYAEARTQLAAIHERRGRYEAALREIQSAATVEPTRSLELYAVTLRAKSGDFDGAVRHLEALLEETPGDDELLYNLGVIYGEAKEIDEAIRYMKLALEQNPDNASALNYIGYTWAERGVHLDDAERMITRAVELRPDDGYIADSLGWVYYMRARSLLDDGRAGEAQEWIDKALAELYRADTLTGGDPVVSEHIGDVLLLQNERERALERFEEALRLEPREGEQPQLHDKLESLRRELR